MKDSLKQAIIAIVQQAFHLEVEVELTRPDEKFGDFATNVALQLAKQVGQNPRQVAEIIVDKLATHEHIVAVKIAGPGFINITLTDTALWEAMQADVTPRSGSLVLEYSCPNAFKELHVGHLYQTILGDALARVYERLGTTVLRVNYGGDVGLHVAKSMWAILQEFGGEHPEKLADIPAAEHTSWLAKVYVAGSAAYETSDDIKTEIATLNKRIYELHNSADHDSNFAQIYWQARTWSYDYFHQFYADLAVTPFDRYIGESETYQPGLQIVHDHIGDVFQDSDGAIVLDKAKSGLHTRVFITSQGLPTYEAKDLGVITLEADEFGYDQRIIMTGNDQKQYMQVVFAAMRLIDPVLGAKQFSLTNGTVKFADGQKMSSRLGNVTRAVDVITAARQAVTADNDVARQQIALSAVKYTFLKNSLGDDMAFDLEQSVSLEGNSGPYLQYALVRARSILRKADMVTGSSIDASQLEPAERALTNWLSRYPETLLACIEQRSLHGLCSYLYNLAQLFNRFYEQSRVLDDERSPLRIELVKRYATTLQDGLHCLGIDSPDKM